MVYWKGQLLRNWVPVLMVDMKVLSIVTACARNVLVVDHKRKVQGRIVGPTTFKDLFMMEVYPRFETSNRGYRSRIHDGCVWTSFIKK